MNLLLTNDDGYDCEGIKVLARELSKDNNVFILAPDRNRSAVSSHMTLFDELKISKIGENSWKCSGYPADCVIAGLCTDLAGVKFDAVISGINLGANIGTDIVYSGTCGAARQAVLYQVPGIAVSIQPVDWKCIEETGWHFDAIARFVSKNLKLLVDLYDRFRGQSFINVNGLSIEKYKGVRISDSLCKKKYSHIKYELSDGEDCMSTAFKFVDGKTDFFENDDFFACNEGYISISAVFAEPGCMDLRGMVDCNNFSL